MKYLLLMYHREDTCTPADLPDETVRAVQLCNELHAQSKWVGGSPLQPISVATSVRVRGERRQVTDGPFAETKEQLAGYALVDVENVEQAIDIAARFPAAALGTVEVRALDPAVDGLKP